MIARKQQELFASALGLALCGILLAYLPGLDLPGEAPREALALLAAPLLLGIALWTGRSRAAPPFCVLLGVATIGGALAALLVPEPERWAALRDLLLFLAPWLAALGVALACGGEDALPVDVAIERAAVFSLTVLGALGLAQAWWGWEGLAQSNPPAATLVNKNVAAHVLVLLVPIAAGTLATRRPRWERWVGALATGLGMAFLIATRARGAWLAALVGWTFAGGIALAVRHRSGVPRRVRWRTLAPAALPLALAVVALFVPVRGSLPLPSVASTLGTLAHPFEGTGAIRFAIWRNTLAMIGEHPWFGIGPGRFVAVYPRYQAARVATPRFGLERQPEHVENDPLELAAELGAPAAAAVLALLCGGLWRTVRQAMGAGDTITAGRAAARAAAIGGLLLHALTSFPLHSAASAMLAASIIGRAWSGGRASGTRWRRALAALAFCCALALAWLGARELRSQRALADALRAHAAGACDEATARARTAARLAPWRRRENGMAAMVLFECAPDSPAALAAVQRALTLHPHQLNLLLARGAAELKHARPAEAERAFREALAIAPALGRAWLGVAMARDALGDRGGAQSACRSAVQTDPQFAPARQFCEGNGYVRR